MIVGTGSDSSAAARISKTVPPERSIHTRLPFDAKALEGLCQRHQIRKLSLFGSRLKGTARPDSDVDLLVEFMPDARPTLLDMAEIERELSELLDGATVDLGPPKISVGISGTRSSKRRSRSMRPDDLMRLKHMHDATASALRFVEGRVRQELNTDEMPLLASPRP